MALGQFVEGQFPAQLAAQSLKGGEGVYWVAPVVAADTSAKARGAILYAIKKGPKVGVV